jgi:hypothetical protein
VDSELVKSYVQLVRYEADTKNELAKRQAAILRAARVAIYEGPKSIDEEPDWFELQAAYREQMTAMFELLLTAPENKNFTARPQPRRTGFSRFRNITVEGFGELEAACLSSPDLSGETKISNYRLAVVGLPEGFTVDPPLNNSPILAQLNDFNLIPLGRTEPISVINDVARLKDQTETLEAVCRAAGLLPEEEPEN